MTTVSRRSRSTSKVPASALVVLTGIFFLAGISRLGLGVAEAIAAENNALPAGRGGTAQAVQEPDPSDLFETLRAREARLQQEEERVKRRAEEIRQAEADIRAQLQALEQAEERLLQTLSLTETAAENDVTRLTTIYENMKPRQAAEMFSQMDVTFAAGFFARLRPDFAGAVMAELDPMTAYAISAVLAGRNAGAPKN